MQFRISIVFLLETSIFLECKLNVHKRCTRNVANDCGIDKKKLALVLIELGINIPPPRPVKSIFILLFSI